MNCKPGDLAVIVRSETGRNYGRIVRIVGLCTDNYVSPDGEFWGNKAGIWCVVSEGSPLTCSYKSGRIAPGMYAPYTDSALRPIRGIPVDEHQKDEVPA